MGKLVRHISQHTLRETVQAYTVVSVNANPMSTIPATVGSPQRHRDVELIDFALR